MTINHQFDEVFDKVDGHGAAIWTPVVSLEAEHQASVREMQSAGSDMAFIGGAVSSGWA